MVKSIVIASGGESAHTPRSIDINQNASNQCPYAHIASTPAYSYMSLGALWSELNKY